MREGHPYMAWGQMMETPKYARINAAELEEIQAEFGRPLTEELALWLIRNRINREAVERMLGNEEPEQAPIRPKGRHLQKMTWPREKKSATAQRRICA